MRFFRRKHNNDKTTVPPTYKEFLYLFDLCSEEVKRENLEILGRQPRPDTLCGRVVPRDLNALSYGQLDDLRDVADSLDIAHGVTQIVFGETLNILDEDVNNVFGFINFCTSEVERINKLFMSIKPNYTSEEKAAGVDSLDFGSFGVLDWYAKRMGITDQNEVRSIAWVRIYQCMKNDNDQHLFERRLQDQYMKRSKGSSGARKRR